MITNDLGRSWGNAPSGVRSVRSLAWLAVVIIGIAELVMVMLAVTGASHGTPGLLGALFVAFPLAFYIWLLIGLKQGTKAAYYVQLVLAILGLIGFPLGTLINGYILYLWFKPETKAWFGV